MRVTLLGRFTIKLGERSAGPWYRPGAKRVCELVMVSPGRRIGREMARELLFPNLAPAPSANALSTALSLARDALSPLGDVASGCCEQTGPISGSRDEVPLDIDAEAHEEALRSALRMEPGGQARRRSFHRPPARRCLARGRALRRLGVAAPRGS